MGKCFVLDTLAPAGGVRIHDIITEFESDGKTPRKIQPFKLSSETATEMESDSAMIFLKDKAFIVTDANGQRIDPMPIDKDGGLGGMKLNPGEVVAALEELTTKALYRRCKIVAASSTITDQSSREDMIAFLTDQGVPKDVVNKTEQPAGADVGGMMSESQLANLFPE